MTTDEKCNALACVVADLLDAMGWLLIERCPDVAEERRRIAHARLQEIFEIRDLIDRVDRLDSRVRTIEGRPR